MKEDSSFHIVSPLRTDNGINTIDQEFLRKYSCGRRVPKGLTSDKINVNTFKIAQVRPLKIISDRSDSTSTSTLLANLDSPPKLDRMIAVESPQKETSEQLTIQEEIETTSMVSPKSDVMSDAAILKSVLRQRVLPVPPEKVGIVREPQVIVRKFNIPMLCPQNKFTKLKERWKYQHDVVGLANIKSGNVIHKFIKSNKPVTRYTIPALKRVKPTNPTVGIVEPNSSYKMTTNTILPKNHIAGPSRFHGSNVNGAPSLPSTTPTAAVKGKPVQVLALSGNDKKIMPSAKSGEGGKFIILKPVQESQNSISSTTSQESGKSDIEGTSSIKKPKQIYTLSHVQTSNKIPKPNTIVLQGNQMPAHELDKEQQNGKRVIYPFADSKDIPKSSNSAQKIQTSGDNCLLQQSEASSALRNSLLGMPLIQSPAVSTAAANNTLHLEILSRTSAIHNSTQTASANQEQASGSLSMNLEENSKRKKVLVEQSDGSMMQSTQFNNATIVKSSDGRAFTVTRKDNCKPVTVIKVPASASETLSQLLLKKCQSVTTLQSKESTASATLQNVVVSTKSDQKMKSTSNISIQQQDQSESPTSTHTSVDDTVKTSPNITSQNQAMFLPPLVMMDVNDTSQQKIKSEKILLQSSQTMPLQRQSSSVQVGASDAPRQIKKEVVVINQSGVPSQLVTGSTDALTKSSLALLNTRQTIALQFQRDMLKARDEVRVTRTESYPARIVQLSDSSTQTSLFSMLEPGRLVEMTITAEPNAKGNTSITMPSPVIQPVTAAGTNKQTKSAAASAKHIVKVDSNGCVLLMSNSSEPQCKKMRLDDNLDPSHTNIYKILQPSAASNTQCNKMNSSESSLHNSNNINEQSVGNINNMLSDLLQKTAIDSNSDVNISLRCGGQNLMNNGNSSIRPVVNEEVLLKKAYKDWLNCLVKDDDGNIPLHLAVLDEDINQVKRQCFVLTARKSTVDVHNYEKMTPLHLAVCLGLADIVHILLKFQAQPSVVDGESNTALHLATKITSNVDCVNALLKESDCKSSLNLFNDEGYSPLHLCALNGRGEVMVALLRYGANINLKDAKSGRTALFHSVESRDSKLSRVLVQYGASASIPNFAGHTPLLATNDVSMLGSRAVASVMMARNSFYKTSEEVVMQDDDVDSNLLLEDSNASSWKIFDSQDR